jgi:hypothetical protein
MRKILLLLLLMGVCVSQEVVFSDSPVLNLTCPVGVLPGASESISCINLRALVVVNHPPLGIWNESWKGEGFMADAMRELEQIAMDHDNVTLQFQVEMIPLSFKDNTFDKTLNMVAIDCNQTSNPMPLHDCQRYDILVGSYWPNPGERSLRTLYSPPLLETGYVTLRHSPDPKQTSNKQLPIESLHIRGGRLAYVTFSVILRCLTH